jgi:hypothetical protein
VSYAADRKWSDQYLQAIRCIVGPKLLVPAPLAVDMKEAADLIVLRARDMTIACRVRRPGYAARYPWQFTIRAQRDSGARTELAKIIDGWGDWMFYGHASKDPGAIDRWFLVDLHVWRAELARDAWRAANGKPQRHAPSLQLIPNGDGTHFAAFDVRRFPSDLLIASSHEVPYEKAAGAAPISAVELTADLAGGRTPACF